jgi:Leucine-rich repeat (LRR) protein
MMSHYESQPHLEEVDFSLNELTRVPDALFVVKTLRKLDLSDNKIDKIEPADRSLDTYWEQIETLNLSRNELRTLPDALGKMTKLRILMVNNNKLTFNGWGMSRGLLTANLARHPGHNRQAHEAHRASSVVQSTRTRARRHWTVCEITMYQTEQQPSHHHPRQHSLAHRSHTTGALLGTEYSSPFALISYLIHISPVYPPWTGCVF